jgi:hypothetical protein
MSVDTVVPTIAIGSNKASLKAGETATLTFTLSEGVSDFVEGDLTVAGGSITNFTALSTTSYTAIFTPTAGSTANGVVSVASNGLTDAAGNTNAVASNTITMMVDTIAPTIAIVSNKTSLKVGETAALTFTLSEGTSDFVASDVTVSGGALGAFAGVGTSYTATFTPTANSADIARASVASGKFTDGLGNANSAASNTITISVDTIAPTISISSNKSSLKAGETATLTFMLSEGASDFDLSDLKFTGGSIGNFTAVSSANYTATFTPTAGSNANGVVSVSSGKFADAAGNANSAASNTVTISVDTITPTIAIASKKMSLKAGETATLTFTLSESSTDFVVGDVTTTGGTLSAFAGSGANYSATFTPDLSSTTNGVVSVANDRFTGAAGNQNADGSDTNNTVTMVVDTVLPTIAIASNKASLKAGEAATFTFTLSEQATNFVIGDIAVAGGTLGTFAGSGTSYTATFTPTPSSNANGVVNVASAKFTDAAGNQNADESDSNNTVTMSVDTVVPTIAIASNKTSLKAGETATLTFTLSEPSANFDASDLKFTGGSISEFTAVTGASYTATFTPTASSIANGVVSVSSGKFTDAAGNPNGSASNVVTMTVDTVLPTITVASNRSKLKTGETATLTFTLSESATEFVVGDVTVSGGALSAFAGNGTSYTATFTPTANITDIARVSVESGKFTDAAGNPNEDGSDVNNAVNIMVDTIRPTVFIVSDPLTLNAAETATLTFTLSESARDFVASDIAVTGGTLSAFAGTGTTYTATFTPKVSSTANGVVSVASSKFTDAAGNTNSASSNTLTLAVDTVPPSIAITTNSTSLRSNESARITFKLSELSTDFGADDLSVSNGSISDFAGSGQLYYATFTPETDVIADGFVSVMSGAFSDRAGNFNIDGGESNNTVKLSARLGLSIAAPENKLGVTTVKVVDALLGNAPTFALSGIDAAQFKLSTAGVLTFSSPKDFEKPVDKNLDGQYQATVTITNSKTGYKVIRDLTVEVTFVPLLGTEGNDKITGTSGVDTLDGLIGDDILTGGQGRDTFLVSSGKDLIADFSLLTPGEKGSEILKVSFGAIASAALKAPWVATADSVNFGTANLNTPGQSVDLSSITLGGGWNVRNTGQATTIKGSQFSDVLIGGTGKDTLSGGDGDDLVIGGKGSDVLSGGPGSDTFRFGGDSSTDLLTDFEPGVDRIELDSALFKALLIGSLADDQFLLGTKALTLTQRVYYDQTKGSLYYDADGSGRGAAILIGILNNKAPLDYTDFLIS